MSKKNTTEVMSINARPYDPSSALSLDRNTFKHFDGRNDFLLFAHQTHVAVLLWLINTNYDSERPKGQNFSLKVSISDNTTGETKVLKTIKGRIYAERMADYRRVDLPFSYSDVDSSHTYTINVADTESDRILESKEIRFYNLPQIKKLPTKWFKVRQAFVNTSHPWNVTPMRSPGSSCRDTVQICFDVEYLLPCGSVPVPELTIHTVDCEGNEEDLIICPEAVSDEEPSLFKANRVYEINRESRGVHYAELQCMGHAFSGFLFSTDGEEIDGVWSGTELGSNKFYTLQAGEERFQSLLETIRKPVAEEIQLPSFTPVAKPMSSFDRLTGLKSVKSRLTQYTQMVRFNSLRMSAGLPTMSHPLHCMFLGSPGTGKTTVARIIGKELQALGVLSKGHVVVRERATLLGQYYSSESENTLKALEEAQGGILFIDEAYQLCQPQDPRDPGRFVIESLMTALADENRRDWMLILAGYEEPMKELFKINPGLCSRIPKTNIYLFEDYSEDELFEIAERYLAEKNFTLSEDASRALRRRLNADYESRDSSFGNARHVITMIQTEIFPAMAERMADAILPSLEDLTTILASDITPAQAPAKTFRRSVGFAV